MPATSVQHGKLGRPEGELLHCAAHVSVLPEQAERLAVLLRQDLDWEFLIERARAHGVASLLAWQLQGKEEQAVPKGVLAHLRSELQETAARILLLGRALL